jgi:hypothetical protein
MKKRQSDLVMLVAYFKACKMPALPNGAIRGIQYVGFANLRTNIYVSGSGKMREGDTLENSHRMAPNIAELHIQAARRHKASLEVQNV